MEHIGELTPLSHHTAARNRVDPGLSPASIASSSPGFTALPSWSCAWFSFMTRNSRRAASSTSATVAFPDDAPSSRRPAGR